MADATESQQATPRRRRGRPPGSKTTRRRVAGGDLIGQLNKMVAELIKEKEVRGNFGFTFDLDTIFAKFKPF